MLFILLGFAYLQQQRKNNNENSLIIIQLKVETECASAIEK